MLEKVAKILQDTCEIEEDITLDSRFVEDFGLSSLDMFNLITEIEEEFDISIPTRKLQGICCVADLLKEIG